MYRFSLCHGLPLPPTTTFSLSGPHRRIAWGPADAAALFEPGAFQMKRLFATAIPALLVLTLASVGHAQLAVGVRAGLSYSSLGGDVKTDSKTGFMAGAFAGIGISGNWGIQPEISYVQKGAKIEGIDPGTAETQTITTKLDYIELQLPVDVDLPVESESVNPRLYAGPTFGIALSCKVESDAPEDQPVDCKDDVKSTDYGLVFGIGVELGSGPGAFVADLRYDMGLANINDAGSDPTTSKNRGIQILIGYRRGI
jgi:hypothetical protein